VEKPHLPRIERGQKFQMCESHTGTCPFSPEHPEATFYNLLGFVLDNPIPGSQKVVKPADVLVVDEAEWTVKVGWYVKAQRLEDGVFFHFTQRIDDKEWRQHLKSSGKQSSSALWVCHVTGP